MALDYEARSALRELPGHTCPAIDRIIRDVNDAINAISSAKIGVEDVGVLRWLDAAENELADVEDALEKVRAANLGLRQAAETHIETCSELRREISALEPR